MKNRKRLIAFLVLFLAAVVFAISCKKNYNDAPKNSEVLRASVSSWYEHIKTTASENVLSTVNAVISGLNYNDGLIIKQGDKRTVLLIRKQSSGYQPQYLALSESPGGIVAEGIYAAKGISQIESFLKTKVIPVGEKITVYSFAEKPLVQWETTTTGKSLLRMVKSKISLTTSPTLSKQLSATLVVKLNSAPPPPLGDPGQCTDWYWVTFDPDSGVILDVMYLYNTCDGAGTNGTTGNTTGEDMVCLNSAIEEASSSVASEGDITVSEDEAADMNAENITRTRTYHWQIWHGLTWDIKSHETGVHKYLRSDNQWHWVSLTHKTTSVEGFWAGGGISCDVSTATPSVYDKYAGMELYFTLYFDIVCKGSPARRTKAGHNGTLFEVNQ